MEDVLKLVIGILIVLSLLFVLSEPLWAYDPPEATRILQQQGYKDIKIKGYAWFACDKSDTWQTEFEATAPNGTKTEGAVCGGLLWKANTVRLY